MLNVFLHVTRKWCELTTCQGVVTGSQPNVQVIQHLGKRRAVDSDSYLVGYQGTLSRIWFPDKGVYRCDPGFGDSTPCLVSVRCGRRQQGVVLRWQSGSCNVSRSDTGSPCHVVSSVQVKLNAFFSLDLFTSPFFLFLIFHAPLSGSISSRSVGDMRAGSQFWLLMSCHPHQGRATELNYSRKWKIKPSTSVFVYLVVL